MGSNPVQKTKSEKIQPWRSHWLAMHQKGDHQATGTRHGFPEGEAVIMDGNISFPPIPVVGKKPSDKAE